MPEPTPESQPEPQPEPARRSIWRPSISQLIVAALIGGLAFAVTLQIRNDETDDYAGVRGDELVELLKSLDSANQRLGSQIDELTVTRNELLTSTRRSEEAEDQARQRSEDLSILAGTSGARGPGISLEIDDPEREVFASTLLDAVQELRDAGAEAVVINGVARVVSQTYFLDVDDGIRVGGREISPPYTIEAIGDSSTLSEAVRFRGGLVDRVANRGGSVDVTVEESISITALADVKTPEYARPTS